MSGPVTRTAAALALALVTLLALPGTPARATPADIPDKAFRSCIVEALALPAGAAITAVDLAGIERLDCSSRGIRSISGVERLSNLTALGLYGNPVTSLTPLGGLGSLTNLDLAWTALSDLTPLAGLHKLQVLDLAMTSPRSLHPLAGLTGIKRLDLSGKGFVDLAALSGLTELTSLNLSQRPIRDLAPLSGLTQLRELWLDRTRVRDASTLLCFAGLEELHLSDTDLPSDISWVAELPQLRRLDLNWLDLTDIAPLASLTRLESLGLSGNRITDLSSLENLQHLQTLAIDRNRINDLSPLRRLPLTNLYAADQAITLRGVAVGASTRVVVTGIDGAPLLLKTSSGARYDGGNLSYTRTGAYTTTWSVGDFSGRVMQAAAVAGKATGTVPALIGITPDRFALAGTAVTADPGSWAPGTRLSYRWTLDGKNIRGATGATYRPTGVQSGQYLRVKVTGRVGRSSVTRTSGLAEVDRSVLLASRQPDISGTSSVGARLSVSRPVYSPRPSRFSYQWYRDGAAIRGATGSTYRLTAASLGHRIQVRVRAYHGDCYRLSLYSLPTAVVTR